jgi:hypothetical protein
MLTAIKDWLGFGGRSVVLVVGHCESFWFLDLILRSGDGDQFCLVGWLIMF